MSGTFSDGSSEDYFGSDRQSQASGVISEGPTLGEHSRFSGQNSSESYSAIQRTMTSLRSDNESEKNRASDQSKPNKAAPNNGARSSCCQHTTNSSHRHYASASVKPDSLVPNDAQSSASIVPPSTRPVPNSTPGQHQEHRQGRRSRRKLLRRKQDAAAVLFESFVVGVCTLIP